MIELWEAHSMACITISIIGYFLLGFFIGIVEIYYWEDRGLDSEAAPPLFLGSLFVWPLILLGQVARCIGIKLGGRDG